MDLILAFSNVKFAKEMKSDLAKHGVKVLDIVSSEEDLLDALMRNPKVDGVLLRSDLAIKLGEQRLETLSDVIEGIRKEPEFKELVFTVMSDVNAGHPFLAELVELGIYNIFEKGKPLTVAKVVESFKNPNTFSSAAPYKQVDPDIQWRKNFAKSSSINLNFENRNKEQEQPVKPPKSNNPNETTEEADTKVNIFKEFKRKRNEKKEQKKKEQEATAQKEESKANQVESPKLKPKKKKQWLVTLGLVAAILATLTTFGFVIYSSLMDPSMGEIKAKAEKSNQSDVPDGQMVVYYLKSDLLKDQQITSELLGETYMTDTVSNMELITPEMVSEREYFANDDLKANTIMISSLAYTNEPALTEEVLNEANNSSTGTPATSVGLFEFEYDSIELPSKLTKGDFVDVRIQFPNGADYVLFGKKEVADLNASKVWLNNDEGELLSMHSVNKDITEYKAKVYAVKYSNAHDAVASKATYPVNGDINNQIRESVNIPDKTKYNLDESQRNKLENELAAMGLGSAKKKSEVAEITSKPTTDSPKVKVQTNSPSKETANVKENRPSTTSKVETGKNDETIKSAPVAVVGENAEEKKSLTKSFTKGEYGSCNVDVSLESQESTGGNLLSLLAQSEKTGTPFVQTKNEAVEVSEFINLMNQTDASVSDITFQKFSGKLTYDIEVIKPYTMSWNESVDSGVWSQQIQETHDISYWILKNIVIVELDEVPANINSIGSSKLIAKNDRYYLVVNDLNTKDIFANVVPVNCENIVLPATHIEGTTEKPELPVEQFDLEAKQAVNADFGSRIPTTINDSILLHVVDADTQIDMPTNEEPEQNEITVPLIEATLPEEELDITVDEDEDKSDGNSSDEEPTTPDSSSIEIPVIYNREEELVVE